MKSIGELAAEVARQHEEALVGEMVKFVRSLRRDAYFYIPYKDILNRALKDGYIFSRSEEQVFSDIDRHVSGIKYTFYATRLNIEVASRTRTITEHYIIGD